MQVKRSLFYAAVLFRRRRETPWLTPITVITKAKSNGRGIDQLLQIFCKCRTTQQIHNMPEAKGQRRYKNCRFDIIPAHGSKQQPVNFNSHAPCGARPLWKMRTSANPRFQLTRPLRGATQELCFGLAVVHISTHTPLAGRDRPSGQPLPMPFLFQLTRPLRGATDFCIDLIRRSFISTHTPLAGRDPLIFLCIRISRISTHNAPCGARRGSASS